MSRFRQSMTPEAITARLRKEHDDLVRELYEELDKPVSDWQLAERRRLLEEIAYENQHFQKRPS